MRSRYLATAKPGRPRGRIRRRNRKRSSFAGPAQGATEAADGRTEAAQVRTFIHTAGVTLSDDERALTRRKLGTKLGKFLPAIERVSVRVADINGPRGGVDQTCRVKVVLSGLPSVVFENRDASRNAAIDAALTGAERAVGKTLRRRRMKPLKLRA
jgi:hypothetical protein